MDRDVAWALYREAREAWAAEDWLRSASAYEPLLRAFPDGPDAAAWWFDAALAYKFLRDWPKAYSLGLEAAARSERGVQDPAYWNLGIAATVLREWSTARDAWSGYGVTITPGTGPIEQDFGVACVRINTDDGSEVVWARRLCPTRARVLNVPLNPARRYGEVVLHDGAPNGERISGGRTYSVFDEIMLFEPSELATVTVSVTATTSDDVEALRQLFADRHDFGVELPGTVVVLCRCCSEGTVEHNEAVRLGQQTVLLAAPMEVAGRLLDEWRVESPASRSWTDLHLAT